MPVTGNSTSLVHSEFIHSFHEEFLSMIMCWKVKHDGETDMQTHWPCGKCRGPWEPMGTPVQTAEEERGREGFPEEAMPSMTDEAVQ